jgi:DMSO/TMAO reductase YedYZ molybdopterin-dependent catalytic subunit
MSIDDVSKHNSAETGLWVTLNGCVYDISQFTTTHPGGDKILAARGGSVEPFWSLYPVHYSSPLVLQHLDKLRVGVLNKADRDRMAESKRQLDANSPFKDDPERHAGLRVLQETPFNAEAPMALVGDEYITPEPLWFARHHHPVPVVDPAAYRLEAGVDAAVWKAMQEQAQDGLALRCLPAQPQPALAQAQDEQQYSRCRVEAGGRVVTPEPLQARMRPAEPQAQPPAAAAAAADGWVSVSGAPELSLRLEDLEAMTQQQLTSTIVCAGNRRAELNEVEPTDGLTWTCGAASTGAFEGVWMRDVMAAMGVDEARAMKAGWNHMVMTGIDAVSFFLSSLFFIVLFSPLSYIFLLPQPFDASVSANKALSPSGGCMLALRMNDQQLTRDHGYPVRAIVPGK